MTRSLLLLGAALFTFLGSGRAEACAGCSNPNLPQVVTGRGRVRPREWSVGLALSATALRVVHESTCPEIGPVCATRDEPPQLHDQAIRVGELRLLTEYGLSEDWALQLQLPVKVIDTSIIYRRLDGSLYEPDYVNIHHRNETLAGVTDPWVTVKRSMAAGRWALASRLGTTIPLGRTVDDPFAAAEAGEAHQHFQFGTGTFNPLLGFDAARSVGSVALSGYLLAQLVPYASDRGFRAGQRASAGINGAMPWGGDRGASVSLDVVHEEAERWGGVVKQDGNLGRTDLLAGGGLDWAVGHGRIALLVRTPVWQRIVGGQVSYPAIATLVWQTASPTPR